MIGLEQGKDSLGSLGEVGDRASVLTRVGATESKLAVGIVGITSGLGGKVDAENFGRLVNGGGCQ